MYRNAIDVRIEGPNALHVKDEGYEVCSGRNGGVANIANDIDRQRIASIFGAGFSEQLPRAATLDVCSFNNDVSNAVLIRKYPVK